jgi:hypothetical protein
MSEKNTGHLTVSKVPRELREKMAAVAESNSSSPLSRGAPGDVAPRPHRF